MSIKLPEKYRRFTGIILFELEKRGIDVEDFNVLGETYGYSYSATGCDTFVEVVYNNKTVVLISEAPREREEESVETIDLPGNYTYLWYKLSTTNPKNVILNVGKGE